VRTTIVIDDDVLAAIEQERRREGGGLSRAVNRLIRRGLRPAQVREPFVQRSHDLGMRVDVSNVAEALELLDAADRR